MSAYLIFLIILVQGQQAVNSRSLLLRRLKRDFVPPGTPGLSPPRYLPDYLRPEHVDPNNPYLESLTEPYYPAYGLGVGYQNPFILGGAANVPTGNIFRPSESINGTLGVSRMMNFRMGTQGGPFYPWQDPKFAGSAKYLAMLQYQQQQQQAQLADQATQQALAVRQQAANNAVPANPFASPNLAVSNRGLSRQQMPAYMLATPPPLPTRFHL